MALRLALRTNSTLSNAWVNALVCNARLVIRALRITLTFTPYTAGQSVTGVTGRARAYRPFLVATIVPRRTDGIRSARIRIAQILLGKRTAADERIAGHIPRAATNRRQTTQITVRTDATCALARVLADAVDASRPPGWAVPVTETFRPTLRVRTTDVTLRALANGPVAVNACAGCPLTALVTAVDALELAAVLVGATLHIRFALVPAARQRRTDVSRQTGTGRYAVDNAAFGIRTARTGTA